MVQTAQLISVLKQFLKRHGFSYRDVARRLNLSEASVKRFSLSRLDNVCQMMGMEISDLVVEMNQQAMASHISQLTEEQEQILVSDPVLLLVTICVLNGWTMTDLQSHYHLTRLDSLNLIVLLPLNVI
jgi:DNA-binding Xre family transcriptional regulator